MARPCVASLLTMGVDAKRQGIITGRARELLAGLTAGQRASQPAREFSALAEDTTGMRGMPA